MWKIWREIHVCPKVKYGFNCANFLRLTVTQYSFVDILCTEFYLKQAKYVENMSKILHISLCNSMAFNAQISMQLIVIQMHEVEVSYIKFHPATENVSRFSFIHFSKV